MTTEMTMATLVGSDKQVAWATDIRTRRINELVRLYPHRERDYAGYVESGRKSQDEADQYLAMWRAAIEILAAETSAKWWIESRAWDDMAMVRQVATQDAIAAQVAAVAAARAAAAAPVVEVVETVAEVVETVAQVVETVETVVAEMPALVGTEKQATWAAEIRDAKISQALHYRSNTMRLHAANTRNRAWDADNDAAIIKMARIASAEWWIKQRSRSIELIINQIVVTA